MYVLAGQTLNFTTGKVSFDGTGLRKKLDPTLDFTAQTVSGGVTATLQITGYASEPKIQLSSTPQLPQDEILARLLFRQSAKEMSPFQLAEIAQAAASLSGVRTSFNPLGAVRNRLGKQRREIWRGRRSQAVKSRPERRTNVPGRCCANRDEHSRPTCAPNVRDSSIQLRAVDEVSRH
jgi:translocation and assembly module TamB